MKYFRTIYTVWLREMRRFWRDRSRLIGNLAMPFMFLAFLGVGFNSSFSIPGLEGGYIGYLAPGIIGMSLMFTAIFTGISVIFDKQFGFLREMLVAPASRWSIVGGKILGSSTITLISGFMILGIAFLLISFMLSR